MCQIDVELTSCAISEMYQLVFLIKKTLNTQKIVIGSRVPREKSHFHRKTNAPKTIFMVLKMLGNVERSPALYWKIIFYVFNYS